MAKVNGTNLVVVVNGVCVAGGTSCTLNVNQNLYDTTTKDSAGYSEHGKGLRDWSIDFDGLYDPSGVYSAEELIDSILCRTALTVEFATEGAGNGGQKWSGSASLENVSLAAGLEEAATLSGTFKGTGVLAKGTVTAS